MNQCYEQYFPTDFISEYLSNGPSFARDRFLTYVSFRFLSAFGQEECTFAASLQKKFAFSFEAADYKKIEHFLSEDFYFSTGLAAESFDPYYLLAAITIVADESGKSTLLFEELLAEKCPAIASTDFDIADLDLASLISTVADFYAVLYQSFTKHRISFDELLPKLGNLYWEELHFSCEDFVLYDFMNEYFDLKNCLSDEGFVELIDTLANATLGYQKTSIEQLLNSEIKHTLYGTASKFAAMKRYGFIQIPELENYDDARKMLMDFFRYAAAYELRNHLFDYHLDEDKLITLENWKEKLHWHYVQYSNVFELALSSFYAACLSQKLLKAQFAENLLALR